MSNDFAKKWTNNKYCFNNDQMYGCWRDEYVRRNCTPIVLLCRGSDSQLKARVIWWTMRRDDDTVSRVESQQSELRCDINKCKYTPALAVTHLAISRAHAIRTHCHLLHDHHLQYDEQYVSSYYVGNTALSIIKCVLSIAVFLRNYCNLFSYQYSTC